MPEVILELTGMRLTPTLSIILAMFIATLKAGMVCTFFMHLKYDAPFNRAVFLSGLFFCAFFFIFTLGDTLTRDTDLNTHHINEHTPKEFLKATEKTTLNAEETYPGRRIFEASNGLVMVGAAEGYTKDGLKIGAESSH